MGDEQIGDDLPLGEILPGLADLAGMPTNDQIGGPLKAYLERRDDLTWAGLAAVSPREIALIPNVGPVRTKRILSNLGSFVGADTSRKAQRDSAADDPVVRLLHAVQEVAAWAVGSGRGGSVIDGLLQAVRTDDSDVPRGELDWLAATPAESIITADRVAVYDPVCTANLLIGGFDERERATLDRVLDFDGSAPTLQELGDRFGVTGERIRQVESKVTQRLARSLAEPDCRSLVAAADRLRERLGAAIPADLLSGEFAEYPPDLLDRLILHLAGPYRFDGDWYVLESLAPFTKRVMDAFDSVADDGVASLAALQDALAEIGIRPGHIDRALAGESRLWVLDDQVLDWRGSLNDKAVLALRLTGRPMLFEELVEFVGPNSERSMSNQVHADDRMVKVGVGRFALATWKMDEFQGIVPAMTDRLAAGPVPLEQLRSELASNFGISPNSIGIMASTHPAFLLEAGTVRLRPDDRPYVPSDDIEGTRACYLVDGVWSWRVPVDHDILRGSGRQLPEAFAVHLGAAPLANGMLDSPVGRLRIGWGQYPSIGSLRSAARSLEAEEGDWLFVRRVRPSAVDFVLLRDADTPDDPAGRVRALVGANGSDKDLELVLADALGLRGSVNHDLAEERAALVARRDTELVELLDAASD